MKEPGTVEVEIGRDHYPTRIRAGRHTWVADEPERNGGSDAGPDPYALLLGALGACTAMTLRMYADRKGWPLESVHVALTHRRVHLEDCADCEDDERHLHRIEREIVVTGPLDGEQRARLLHIANRCPVHRTLTERLEIATSLR